MKTEKTATETERFEELYEKMADAARYCPRYSEILDHAHAYLAPAEAAELKRIARARIDRRGAWALNAIAV